MLCIIVIGSVQFTYLTGLSTQCTRILHLTIDIYLVLYHSKAACNMQVRTAPGINWVMKVFPFTTFVVAIKNSASHSGCLLKKRSAAISAKVTPPINMTTTTLRRLGCDEDPAMHRSLLSDTSMLLVNNGCINSGFTRDLCRLYSFWYRTGEVQI